MQSAKIHEFVNKCIVFQCPTLETWTVLTYGTSIGNNLPPKFFVAQFCATVFDYKHTLTQIKKLSRIHLPRLFSCSRHAVNSAMPVLSKVLNLWCDTIQFF